MNSLEQFNVSELTFEDQILIEGGGPLRELLETALATIGSTARGVWDAITFQEPAVQ